MKTRLTISHQYKDTEKVAKVISEFFPFKMAQIVGKYEMGKVLAAGDFDCRTRICTHIVTGAQYAVRIYDKAILSEATWMWNQTREAVQVMRTLPKHENIIEMVECFETTTSLYILMQLHSPLHFTKLYTSETVPFNRTRHLFAQVVRGLVHMHEHNVVHLGLAPDHMLVNDRDVVKIGFLVSCRFYQRGKQMTDMKGTRATVAPEVLRQEPYDPVLADAWSLGVLLYFMLSGGKYPHDGANTSKNILNNKTRPLLNPTIPLQARDLVAKLLCFNSENRMAPSEVMNHPWMQEERSAMDADDDEGGPAGARRRHSSVVDWDAGNEMYTITLPIGLSREEEAALIIQFTWRSYTKRRNALRRRGIQSFRLKKVHSSMPGSMASMVDRRHSAHDSYSGGNLSNSPSITSQATRGSFSPHGVGGGGAGGGGDMSSSGTASPLNEGMKNPMQCRQCGRLPPQRVVLGELPYPKAKYDYSTKGGFQEKKDVDY
jgi:serine/threonine protein kinase